MILLRYLKAGFGKSRAPAVSFVASVIQGAVK
jgi:hypothetical protein